MTRGEFAKGPMGVFKFAQTSEIDANLQGKYPHKMSAKFEGKTFWLRAGLPIYDCNNDYRHLIMIINDNRPTKQAPFGSNCRFSRDSSEISKKASDRSSYFSPLFLLSYF